MSSKVWGDVRISRTEQKADRQVERHLASSSVIRYGIVWWRASHRQDLEGALVVVRKPTRRC